MNALVNPGAIAATSMIEGATADEVWAKIIGTYNDYAGRQLSVLEDVYESEAETNQRNQAHRDAHVRLRPHQGRAAAGLRRLHQAAARWASTPRTWP